MSFMIKHKQLIYLIIILICIIGGAVWFGITDYQQKKAEYYYYNEFPEDFFDADNTKKSIKLDRKIVGKLPFIKYN